MTEMTETLSDFLHYLAKSENADTAGIPSLEKLSDELSINRAALREQLAVARALGLVEVKPRIGTRRLPYTFTPTLQQSVGYAIMLDKKHFHQYSDLRINIENAYFEQAARALTAKDIDELEMLVWVAWEKLRSNPPQIPHQEHRDLHLKIYSCLDNIFVLGILEAYWDAYERVELNTFTDYNYLTKVWQYHSDIVQAIKRKDFSNAHRIMIEHTELISARPDMQ